MKTGTMVLGGGGDTKSSFNLDEKYFSLLDNNSKILYIPVALNRDKVGFESCYDWFSNLIFEHKKDKEVDFTMLLEDYELTDFKQYTSMYLGGGNTYKLLDFIYRHNLDKELKEFLVSGGIIYGGSAGAMILGKDIRTAEEENDSNYLRSDGLNLFGNKSIICHYTPTLDEKIFQIVTKTNSKVIAIPEESGLIIDFEGQVLDKVGDVFIFEESGKKQL